MKPTTNRQKACLAIVSATILAIVALVGADRSTPDEKAKEPKAAPVRNVYFGDLHVHTGWSNDAYNGGTRSTPDDAYLYAKGEGIRLPNGEMVKLIKPLDFMGVTEHAEYQGIMSKLQDPKSPLYNHPFAKDLRSKDSEVRTKAAIAIIPPARHSRVWGCRSSTAESRAVGLKEIPSDAHHETEDHDS